LREGDLKAAFSLAREGVQNGGGPPAHVVLGKILFAQGRLTLAEQEFAGAVRSHPENPEAARYLANVRQELAKGDRP
jgi:cytochrome c-type biogenesis protein CcmH/NrfG